MFTGATTPMDSPAAVNPGLNIRHDNVIWDDYIIVFDGSTGNSAIGAPAPLVGFAGKVITVSYDPAAHTYADVLNILNTATPAGVISPLAWTDGSGTPVAPPAGFFNPTGTNIPLGRVTTSGTHTIAGAHMQTINTGKMTGRTDIPIGDMFYLAHGDTQWDGFKFNFATTGTTGGSVKVSFDSATKSVNVLIDDDTTYDQILAALNDPDGTHFGTSGWQLLNLTVPGDLPVTTMPLGHGFGSDALWWVNASSSISVPGVPSSVTETTTSGVYQPFAYSADGRSQVVGDGMYLQHTDKSWDNLNITFASTGIVNSMQPPGTAPVNITFDGKTVTVIADLDATYEQILDALNHPFGDPINLIPAWTSIGAVPLSLFPAVGDMRWVDGNGMVLTISSPRPAQSGVLPGTTDLMINHTDQKWDSYGITLSAGTAGTAFGIGLNAATKQIVVTYDSTSPPTYQEMLDAINGNWSGKPAGMGAAFTWDPTSTDNPTVLTLPTIGGVTPLGPVTYVPIFNNPSQPIVKTITSGAVWVDITANDIAALFDLDNPASRGSERAAGLFTVNTTVDNDGTGLMRLYGYWVDQNGKEVNANDPNATTYIQTKTAFQKAFQHGVSGGNIITTGAELVTALNNSAYWGMVMCPELIAELAKENAEGRYYDKNDPPVITAELAPGQRGTNPVGTFEEVAYYGNPNEGTALQFLGGYNSANIRFVTDGPNSELYITREPDKITYSQAVLTAKDAGASMTITAAGKGPEYDDVQFVFRRMNEDAKGALAPDRRDGYVEYDPGLSYAFAQATFKDATTGISVPNSAFFITSTERGSVYNNVDVLMRIDEFSSGPDPVVVTFDSKTNQLRISVSSMFADKVTTNDIIQAINHATVPFQADLSYSEDPLNNGTGKLDVSGLNGRYASIGNTKDTGGHAGTVTVWLADANPGPGAPGEPGGYMQPTQEDIVRLINTDAKVGTMFTAKAYNAVLPSDGKQIDFVNDGPIVSKGGLLEKGLVVVHLATDKVGNVTTTAADLVKYWQEVGDKTPSLVDNISISLVRPQGAVWDECGDPYGKGLLATSVVRGPCDQYFVNDIQFVGWNDEAKQQHYVAQKSTGVMTSQRGENSSYRLTAKNIGPEWNDWTIEYVNSDYLTGRFSDNMVDGADYNPCNVDPYTGVPRDSCGELIYPDKTSEKGMALVYDEENKKMIVYLKFGVTTAKDIQDLIHSDPKTRNKWEITLFGDGSGKGLVDSNDNTLKTEGGAKPPGELNGAKLLFGADAAEYYLIFRSREYGHDQFVDVLATAKDSDGTTTFTTTNKAGENVERAYGQDVDALINGIKSVGSGLKVSLNTAVLSLDFTFSEYAGTTPGYETAFTVNGGGATFQVGPDVVSRQQITLGIRSINTVMLGGSTGVLNQIRSGHDADLWTNTNKGFRIIEESLLAITSVRGRLGTLQKATLETNIAVLNDTLQALTEAESQIRDTDFAEETSNLTRAQILVQANMNAIGIANQIPNYMLSLLGGR
jgi:flagellin-like hook-associated protein FlgL